MIDLSIKCKILTFVLVFYVAFSGVAQLSNQVNQYMVYQPFVNYAAASSYQGANAAVFYRNQWTGFPGSPVVYGAAFSVPMYKSVLGLQAFSDDIGVHSSKTLVLNYAYRLKIDKKSSLSFSLSPEVRFLTAKYSEVVSNNVNDPILFYDSQSSALPNFKAGVYYFKEKFYIGFATANLLVNNAVNANFVDTYQTSFKASEIGWFMHGGYQFELSNKNDLLISALVKESKGASIHGDVNLMYRFSENKFGIGASYRTTNDLVGILNFQLAKMFTLSYAYQFDVGGLQAYQGGSHEIVLIYEVPPKRRKKFRTLYCPRF